MVVDVIKWSILIPIGFYNALSTQPWCGIDEKGLRAMHKKGMVEGILDCSSGFDFCEHCIYGKQNRVIFLSKDTEQKKY